MVNEYFNSNTITKTAGEIAFSVAEPFGRREPEDHTAGLNESKA
jgi:hypothetical protein